MMTFEQVLQKVRDGSFSERDKGARFERLVASFLTTYPLYSGMFDKIWLWNEFPSNKDFGVGAKDLGIDLVAKTKDGDYWAVQCKCYKEDDAIDKAAVETFLSTSGKSFYDTEDFGKKVRFTCRLWIDTTAKGFNREAEATIQNQTPEVKRLGYYALSEASVDWQKLYEGSSGKKAAVKRYDPLPHQQTAISQTHEYLKNHDRGKLIMACGTGKTYTSLRIAEKETPKEGGLVLFLVPSIALLGQTLKEWKSQCSKPIHAICICSDATVNRPNSDNVQMSVVDLAYPASTDKKNIARQVESARRRQKTEGGNIVVFSTYQSIDVIIDVQKKYHKEKSDSFLFDLIVCDEAHRTTGVTLSDSDETAFVKVHDDKYIKAKKRVYMTATPRIYSEGAQKKAREANAAVCSMDDPAMYGGEMYRIGFGEAVSKNLLSDYKVLVLTVDESWVNEGLRKSIDEKVREKNEEFGRESTSKKNRNIELNTESMLKIIGVINALSKKSLVNKELFEGVDPTPMRSAVAFCQKITDSRDAVEYFNICGEAYFSTLTEKQREEVVVVEADHVDGTMGAQVRERKLHWLKSADPSKRECKVLNNVRCLSEGVDVPSLDAVMFFSPKNSQIDVVQSVGRVMRKAEGKKYGYIIIPVVVLPYADPGEVLSNSSFKALWTVLNALRAHDDRFDATINQIDLNKKWPESIVIVDGNPFPRDRTPNDNGNDDGYDDGNKGDTNPPSRKRDPIQEAIQLKFAELQGQIYAKIVLKCGSKPYWEMWAADVAKIAERHIENITAIVSKNGKAKEEFDRYISGLRQNINPFVTKQDAIEMLAQHIITQPVFEALFDDYSFVKNNVVSKSLEGIIAVLNEHSAKEDAQTLGSFYESVQSRTKGIDNHEGKQRIIIELYDKFFRTAFPKVTEKLGIVYTPVEVVDFIIHSVEDVLQKEFKRSMTDENVHILDPFTGTGTFITRLLQSGIIKDEDFERKYTKEIHANEIVLLAYYIASINIENVYHDLIKTVGTKTKMAESFPYNPNLIQRLEILDSAPTQMPLALAAENSGAGELEKEGEAYVPFPGICLTDTFQLGETKDGEDLFSEMFPQNSERVEEQRKTPLRVIIGNPPYSVGQKKANDNAQNQQYHKLEERIAETYVATSVAALNKAVYDSYIKAFRWATDRLDSKNGGILAFVTNSGWLDGNGLDGFRERIENEFSSIYVFNLRGAIRGRSGIAAKKEGQNVFNILTGVAITVLVKKPKQKLEKAVIHYYDIGDYHSRVEKLNIIRELSTINNIPWSILLPNEHNDWINKRNYGFDEFIPLIPEKKFDEKTQSFFSTYAIGVATNRDAWVYNFSKNSLKHNMKMTIGFYNEQRIAFVNAKEEDLKLKVENFVDANPKKINWTRSLRKDVNRNIVHKFKDCFVVGLHRPFTKLHLYYDKPFIECPGIWSHFFPMLDSENVIICLPGIGSVKDFSVHITNCIRDVDTYGGIQCFPLYHYEKKPVVQSNLFEDATDDYIRRDAVSDFILTQAQTQYGPRVSKEDIFYYVYGLLHSPTYRAVFANNLKKSLPRLPLVDKPADFWAFSKAGRDLSELHLNYEDVPPPQEVLVNGKPIPKKPFPANQLIVYKMRFPAKGKKDSIIYNGHITISDIPDKAYEYVVNGKSAIEWVMERYQVAIDKDSGIKNDPNDWASEHSDPQYILNLLLSVIAVSIKTVDIVAGLPALEFEEGVSEEESQEE